MDIVKLIYVIVIYVKIILLIFSLSFTFISSEIKLWEKIIDPEFRRNWESFDISLPSIIFVEGEGGEIRRRIEDKRNIPSRNSSHAIHQNTLSTLLTILARIKLKPRQSCAVLERLSSNVLRFVERAIKDHWLHFSRPCSSIKQMERIYRAERRY